MCRPVGWIRDGTRVRGASLPDGDRPLHAGPVVAGHVAGERVRAGFPDFSGDAWGARPGMDGPFELCIDTAIGGAYRHRP
jgi:hypothetical protein